MDKLIDLGIQEDENIIDYYERLRNGRINGIYDIDKTEIWELLFCEKLSSDEVRKRLYGIDKIVDAIKNDNIKISDEKIIKKIQDERLKLEKEKIKLQDQRREYSKLLRIDARFENLLSIINNTVHDINIIKPLLNSGNVFSVDSENEGILLCSDWHSELQVDNFLNKFNKQEFLRRVNLLIDKTIQYGKFHNISKLHVFDLGDLINGIIHINSRVANNELTVTQTMFISELIAEMLCKFSNNFNHIYFYHVLDNHSRVFADKEESISGESFARFIPWYLKPRLQNINNIEIITDNIDDDIGIVNICNKSIIYTHGNNDNINNIVSNLSLMTRIIPDYIFTAHWHHNVENEFHSCEVIVNQSLLGTDEYGKRIRKTSKPSQKFMIFNNSNGRECTYNINLS